MAQTLTQILLLIISGIAVFTIIAPTINSMGETQKETDEYNIAIENAFATNQRLNTLFQQTESLSQQERYRLNRFIPDTIDSIKTAYDLEMLIEKHNLFLITLQIMEELTTPDPVVTNNPDTIDSQTSDFTVLDTDQIAYQDFEIVVAGSYDQFKGFLADIESSAQLFEVQSVTFQATDSDVIQFNLVIRTFGLIPSVSAS